MSKGGISLLGVRQVAEEWGTLLEDRWPWALLMSRDVHGVS